MDFTSTSHAMSPPSAEHTPLGQTALQHGGATTVLLVDQRPDFCRVVAEELRSIGMEVIRATSMAQVRTEYLGRFVDLLLINVDRTDEPSWLRAADFRREYPNVPIWVYSSWSSPVDSTLADHVSAHELIYHDGGPHGVSAKLRSLLAAHGRTPGLAYGIEHGADCSMALA